MEKGTTRHARVFCSNIADGIAALSVEESHHLVHVLRAKRGDEVVIFDGAGHEWTGALTDISDRVARVVLGAPRPAIAEPGVSVVLAVGLLKGDAMANVVRDATMLGAAAIQPFVAAHTALPAAARRSRLTDRWARVAIASAKQCGRAVVPRIYEVVDFEALLAMPVQARFICVEPSVDVEGAPAGMPPPTTALVIVGPEGGWSLDELTQAAAAKAAPLSLGPRTLRAEIAPAIALAALWTCWGWQSAASPPIRPPARDR